MVALDTLWYNFVRIHKTLRVTPAMAAGVSDRLWNMEDVAAMVDAASPKAGSTPNSARASRITSPSPIRAVGTRPKQLFVVMGHHHVAFTLRTLQSLSSHRT